MGSGEKPEADIQRKTRLIKQLKQDAFIKTAVFIAAAVMSFTFIFGIAIVPTNDMFPAVHEGDMVIYAGFGEKTVSTYVSENVGWQALNAVREDRVGIIDITPYAQKGVILLEKQYGQIMEALKTAGQVK